MAQMITRCPACETRFRVVPDQLRISQGWVRCGHCSEIFDAAGQLGDAQAAPPVNLPHPHEEPAETTREPLQMPPQQAQDWFAPDPLPPIDAPQADQPPPRMGDDNAPRWLPHAPAEIPVTDAAVSTDVGLAEYMQAQASEPAAQDVRWIPELHRASTEPPSLEPATDLAAEPATNAAARAAAPPRLVVSLAAESAPLPLRAASATDAMPLPQRAAAEPPRPAPAPARVVAAAPVPRPLPLDPVLADLTFLREAPEPAAPPVVASGAVLRMRLLWSVGTGLALLGLLWQLAVHERDRLAASAPGLRPLLGALCAPLGCSVQPLRRIDAIVIDGSSFHALGESGYRLSLTLRNRAAHPVALPAIALALTDISEQPVVRRVLLPQDLGTPPDALDAHGEWTASVDLQMADNAGRARVVGYRLDPFYP